MGEQNKEEVRLSGYLEKKGGMKLIPAWKQYWFVLKGQLLLYYRSEADYLNISVHKGSINMGLASNIRPGLNRPNIIEIITCTQIITLRTKDRSTQEQWLQAMLESMAVPKSARNSTVPMHMRYSLDNLPAVSKDVQTTGNNNCATPIGGSKDNIIARINRLGGRSYGTGSFESAIHRHSISHRASRETDNDAEEMDKRISQDGSYVSEYAYIDNKLYHRSQSDDIQNLSSSVAVVSNISEDEADDTYEQLPIDCSKKPTQHEHKSTESVEREQHKVTTLQGNRHPVLEPELPLRSSSDHKQYVSDIEEDLEYAECYEEVGLNESKKGNGKENTKVKKKNSKKAKNKDKELKQEPLNKEKNSKNGKNSFFKSVFGHYRKKAETEKISSSPDQSVKDLPEEPAYESVECTPAITAEISESDLSEVSPTKGVCKRSLLPSITLTELQQKLKNYDDHKDSETSNTDKGNNDLKDDEHTEKSSESSPPSLPPRQSVERRPSSPWHDVPTNNSPVDGDSNKFILSQEQQDSLLGTPQGFALLKSKWQAAERGGEWNPELHHLKLLQPPEEDVKREDSDSMPSLSHLYSKVDKKLKITLDKVDSTELNFQSGEQQLTISVSPSHKISFKSSSDVREEHPDTGYGLLNTNREDSKKEEEDSFQQDSLMSCLSSDKEYIISRDSLQAKSLSLEMPTNQKNEKHIQELSNRNSNDLNILLAQLAEITTAPLLTPGATSSLVNYPHSDLNDQLALMEPIRRRRHSEPDYDIPRPHQRLLIQPLSDAERSPDLHKKHRERHQYEDAVSCNLSISPDSLEPVPGH